MDPCKKHHCITDSSLVLGDNIEEIVFGDNIEEIGGKQTLISMPYEYS